MTRVFLDANIYFSGFHSPEGASRLILEAGHRERFTVYSSQLVLREADRNLRKKSSPAALKAFRRYLQDTRIHVVRPPGEEVSEAYEAYLHPKDLPVLGAALLSKADYFITLDRKHFFSPLLLSKIKKPVLMLPGDFLKQIYLKGKI